MVDQPKKNLVISQFFDDKYFTTAAHFKVRETLKIFFVCLVYLYGMTKMADRPMYGKIPS